MRATIGESTAASFRTGLRWGVAGAFVAVLLIFATASPGGLSADRPEAPAEVLTKISLR